MSRILKRPNGLALYPPDPPGEPLRIKSDREVEFVAFAFRDDQVMGEMKHVPRHPQHQPVSMLVTGRKRFRQPDRELEMAGGRLFLFEQAAAVPDHGLQIRAGLIGVTWQI